MAQNIFCELLIQSDIFSEIFVCEYLQVSKKGKSMVLKKSENQETLNSFKMSYKKLCGRVDFIDVIVLP